jgi:hypothetical protein
MPVPQSEAMIAGPICRRANTGSGSICADWREGFLCQQKLEDAWRGWAEVPQAGEARPEAVTFGVCTREWRLSVALRDRQLD